MSFWTRGSTGPVMATLMRPLGSVLQYLSFPCSSFMGIVCTRTWSVGRRFFTGSTWPGRRGMAGCRRGRGNRGEGVEETDCGVAGGVGSGMPGSLLICAQLFRNVWLEFNP